MTQPGIPHAAEPDQDLPPLLISTYHRARALLLIGAVVCLALFWWAGSAFEIPVHRAAEASLLQQPGAVVDLIVTGVLLIVGVCLGSLIAGSIRFDAGLFVATIGLSAFSLRGGSIRYVLQPATGSSVYLVLLLELVLLYALICAAWWVQLQFLKRGLLRVDRERDGLPDTEHPLRVKVQAAFTQAAIMIALMWFFGQSDRKGQALAAVAISAFVSTAAAHYSLPVRPSAWFWFGPLFCGAIGYFAGFVNPGPLGIGQPANHLAIALPLDYASVGPAFAILGYWMSRRWHRDREAAEAM